jgi:hypothetical protein
MKLGLPTKDARSLQPFGGRQWGAERLTVACAGRTFCVKSTLRTRLKCGFAAQIVDGTRYACLLGVVSAL